MNEPLIFATDLVSSNYKIHLDDDKHQGVLIFAIEKDKNGGNIDISFNSFGCIQCLVTEFVKQIVSEDADKDTFLFHVENILKTIVDLKHQEKLITLSKLN